jgi:hypothetical protein
LLQRGERIEVHRGRVPLAGRAQVGYQSQPGEVLEQRLLVFRPASAAVVILDPEQHPAIERARESPHPDGIHDVAKMEVARGTGREAGEGSARESGLEGAERDRRHAERSRRRRSCAMPMVGVHHPFTPSAE